MKLVKKLVERDGQGDIILIPQEDEDMWHIYNLISKGDMVTSVTFRKVVKESSAGSVQSQRMKLRITLLVDTVEYDVQTATMRVKGNNITENPHIKMGQSHTAELALQRKFTLHKHHWDSVALARVETACDPTKTADAAAIVMQQGLAHVCLITSHMTINRMRVEVNIPRKRMGSATSHDKAVLRFYDSVLEGVLRHINFEVVKVVIVASPAYVNEEFLKYMQDQAIKRDLRVLIENRSKFMLAHSASGHLHALKDVISDPTVAAKIADTKAFEEVRALKEFFDMLNTDQDRAFYGYGHCRKAVEHKAIDKLLITDGLFRTDDLKVRQQYVDLVEEVKEGGGSVLIFSSMHVSGQRLADMTGVAALLRFPIPDVEVFESDSSDDESDDGGTTPAATPSAPA